MQGVLDTTAAYEGPLGEWQQGKKRYVSGKHEYEVKPLYSRPGMLYGLTG